MDDDEGGAFDDPIESNEGGGAFDDPVEGYVGFGRYYDPMQNVAGEEEAEPSSSELDEDDNEVAVEERYLEKAQENDPLKPIQVDNSEGDNDKALLETKYLTNLPFSEEEMAEVGEIVGSRIEGPLKELEARGYEYFQEFLSQHRQEEGDTLEQRRKEQALEDAIIHGNPRDYQTAIFEVAKKRNTIVNLGTGFGKTLIALLCIRHYSPSFEEGKQTLFMVPSVALAIQQSMVLRANLPFSVQLSCYASNTTEKARLELSQSNIIVATHGAIHDLLVHYGDKFHMSRFNFLVIDECHYATGNHAYSAIMKRFYHQTPPEKRPRVLGLTASPLLNVKATHSDDHLEKMLSNLESTLDARLVAVTELGVDTRQFDLLHKMAKEQDIPYIGSIPRESLPSIDNIRLHRSRRRELRQVIHLYRDLGPYVVSIYCNTVRNEISRNTFEQETTDDFNRLLKHLEHITEFCRRQCEFCPRGGRTDKLLALEQLLEEEVELLGGAETVGLVFVERRITALALCDYFRHRLAALENGTWKRALDLRKIPMHPEAHHPQADSSNAPAEESMRAEVCSNASNISLDQFADADEAGVVSYRNAEDNREDDDQFADASSDITSNVLVGHHIVNMQVDDHDDADDQFGDAEEVSETTFYPSIPSRPHSGNHFPIHFTPQIRIANQITESVRDVVVNINTETEPSATADAIPEIDAQSSKRPLDQFLDAEDEVDTSDNGISQSSQAVPCEDLNGFSNLPPDSAISAPQAKRQRTTSPSQQPKKVNFDTIVRKRDGRETIRCGALVRNSTQIFKSLNINRKTNAEDNPEMKKNWLHQETKIRDVLSGLRRGEINVLIATSVVEEGVDVQACSFVAVFDSLKSTKGYIQMKGRARQKDANFFVFHDCRDPTKRSLSLVSAQEIERRVHRFISQRDTSVPTLHAIDFPDQYHGESVCLELRAVEEGSYHAKNGTVDLLSAKSLINRYALSLPLDPVVRASKASMFAHLPVYDSHQLVLPSHLPRHIRLINLPEKYRKEPKKERQKMMALMACVRLHSHALLSDRLLPLTRSDLQSQMIQATKKKPREVEFTTPYITNTVIKPIVRKFFLYKFYQKSPVLDKISNIFKNDGRSLALVSSHPIEEIPETHYFHTEFGKVSCCLGTGREIECNETEFDALCQFFVLLMNSRWRRRKRDAVFRPRIVEDEVSTVPSYYIGSLSKANSLDWQFMDQLLQESVRSKEERTQAVRSASDGTALPQPRLWAPLYDEFVTYIAYGPSGSYCNEVYPYEKEGVTTYQDYFSVFRNFDVPPDSLLFDAQRLWILPYSKGSKPTAEKEEARQQVGPKSESDRFDICEELKSVKLPKDGCAEVALANPSVLLLSTFLPQFLHHMETCLIARSFICHCQANLKKLGACLQGMSLTKVVDALTAKSCNEEESYERLEWLGDAVLKLIQTDSLLESTDLRQWISFLHEGDLSFLRSDMGSNDRLEIVCRHLQIDKFILIAPVARGGWAPSALELYSPTQGTTSLEDNATGKICADVIEALLGLVYMEGGYELSLEVGDELQVTLTRGEQPQKEINLTPKPNLLAAAKAFTGHDSFSQYELVEQAFTHPTALHPEVSSYQRLEWIGDAVLCLAVREWIYREFPEAEVGDMVSKEAALVANETLSFLSVKYGLQRQLNHRDQTLPSRIESYVWSVRELGRGLWGTDPPKVLADIVEALIGAVYIDSGFVAGMNAAKHIVEPMLRVFRDVHSGGGSLMLTHPKKKMQEVGGRLLALTFAREEDFAKRKPDTKIWLGRRWGSPDEDGQRAIASVECVGVNILSVADPSSEVAGNRACSFVVSYLGKAPTLETRLQDCRAMIESASSRATKNQEKSSETVGTVTTVGTTEGIDKNDSKTKKNERAKTLAEEVKFAEAQGSDLNTSSKDITQAEIFDGENDNCCEGSKSSSTVENDCMEIRAECSGAAMDGDAQAIIEPTCPTEHECGAAKVVVAGQGDQKERLIIPFELTNGGNKARDSKPDGSPAVAGIQGTANIATLPNN